MTIRVRGLGKRLGARDVVRGIDLDLEPGTIVLVTGPNGAGKSTLLRCLAGVASHAGRIERNGTTGSPVAYLPQGAPLPPRATVGEILRLFGGPTVVPSEILAFGTARAVGELSGGERRRVALAAILALGAPLVVLDEPLADLDASAAAALLARLAVLRDAGATVVIAAPDGDATRAAAISDRVVRLEGGELLRTAGPAL